MYDLFAGDTAAWVVGHNCVLIKNWGRPSQSLLIQQERRSDGACTQSGGTAGSDHLLARGDACLAVVLGRF